MKNVYLKVNNLLYALKIFSWGGKNSATTKYRGGSGRGDLKSAHK
jgi:hypothetical protein